MTNTDHIDVESLSAWADGELSAVAAQRVERHLAECDACRRQLERIRALVASAAALQREVQPPPDAWAGIRHRVTNDASRVTRRWWHNGWLAAAAAVVLVAGTMLLTRGADKAKAAKLGRPGASTPAATSVTLAAVDRRFAPTIAELHEAFESQRGSLAPSTARTLEHSLAVIDTAIADARSALEADPASAALAQMLSGFYQRKVDFLKRATTISSSL